MLAARTIGRHNIEIRLTAPLDARNVVDGQPISAMLVNGVSEYLPKGSLLNGHVHIYTPISRTAKQQSIGLHFDSLVYKGKSIPIVCRLALTDSALIVTRGNKKIKYQAVSFRAPVNTESQQQHCVMGASLEYIEKYNQNLQMARKSDLLANRAALIFNARYGLNAEHNLAFPLKSFTPFKLEPTDQLHARIDSSGEISD